MKDILLFSCIDPVYERNLTIIRTGVYLLSPVIIAFLIFKLIKHKKNWIKYILLILFVCLLSFLIYNIVPELFAPACL